MPPRALSFVIVGGPNGSGKSTFGQGAAGSDWLLETTAINPDKLAREVADDRPTIGEWEANIIAVERTEKAGWRAVAEGESIAVETVLSTEKFLPMVDAARIRGFRTRLVFVSLPDVTLAIGRVKARRDAGGHGVPEESIRRRWARAHANLPTFLAHIDDLLVFSNAGVNPVLVAERIGRQQRIEWKEPEALPDVVRVLRGL